jgi:cellulose synthase/poly-beta-1,6-N-acetylglucosamine synthase-like glycosyltransferase
MIRGALLLGVDIALLLILALVPIVRTGEEDRGDGFSSVVLPMPHKVSPRRTTIFFALVAGSAIFAVAARNTLATWYGTLVAHLTNTVTGTPNLTHSFNQSVLALVPILASFDIIIFALVMEAPVTRRIASALNSVLLMALAISVNSMLLVIWHVSGSNVGPRTLLGEIINIFLGTLVMFRLIMSSFLLPRPTSVRRGRRGLSVDGFLAFISIAAAVAILLVLTSLYRKYAPAHLLLLGPFVAYPLLWLLIFLGLCVFASRGPWPAITDDKLPIDVIIPAYNETAGIHLTLRSIDAAAVRYGGPVRVILADDGSTDGTGDLARAEMAAFRAATGIVVPGRHLGKAAALNTALSYAETHVVVRIDADVMIDDAAFLPLAAWFKDPSVGSVGGMTYPRQDGHSWFHKMRLFECLSSYGFTRQAQARVDAVVCIPGTFTAFVREPTIEFGGFVTGMNGEDADLTMQLGRLGYRIIIDPRIVVFEDVPATLGEFREQRIRWNRAGTQVAARHSPFRAGLCGPRIWLTYSRMLTMRLTAIVRPCVLTYLIALAIVSPQSRSVVLTIFGAYIFSTTPLLATMMVLAVRHNFAHRIPWLICWWGFSMLRRAFVVEALLTLPSRGVRVPLLSRSGRLAEAASLARAERPVAWPPG